MGKASKTRQRRSGRLARELPIQVSGIDASGRDFTTPAHTLVLSRYGAEILLKTELVPDQEVSIGLLGNARDWDARIIGLFSKRPEGFAYGVEFLFQEGNFWGIAFPAVAGTAESHGTVQTSFQGGTEREVSADRDDLDFESLLRKARKNPPAKTYAIRLKCPHHESEGGFGEQLGDEGDQWLILQERREALQQVLETPWDFTCPIHGAQREYPLEAKETDAGFTVRLAMPATRNVVDPARVRPAAKAAPKPRREPRSSEILRVWVQGVDLNGNSFRQSAQSLDISRSGARLDGLGMLTLPGTTIEVRRHWRRALFRIVWTGKRGTAEANQVGIMCLEPGKNLWNFPDGR